MTTVGIDLGGTKCLGVAVDGERVVAETQVPTPSGGDALLDALAAVVRTLGGEARSTVDAVGVGVPGLVDADGVLRFAPNLRAASGLAVCDELERRVGVPVEADNDATCAVWGEHQVGAARGLREVVLVTLGTGIGGGLVTGGRIHRGANRFAGEIGHMVVDPGGPLCGCGRRGCWERYASGSGLGILGRDAATAGRASRIMALAGGDPEAVRGEHVTEALAAGDAEAISIMAEFAGWLALGLANLANAFDPEAFVIGGGLIAAGDALFGPAREAFARQVEGQHVHPEVAILPAALGVRAGAIGAAFLAADRLAG